LPRALALKEQVWIADPSGRSSMKSTLTYPQTLGRTYQPTARPIWTITSTERRSASRDNVLANKCSLQRKTKTVIEETQTHNSEPRNFLVAKPSFGTIGPSECPDSSSLISTKRTSALIHTLRATPHQIPKTHHHQTQKSASANTEAIRLMTALP
jgi:hypothetical protein